MQMSRQTATIWRITALSQGSDCEKSGKKAPRLLHIPAPRASGPSGAVVSGGERLFTVFHGRRLGSARRLQHQERDDPPGLFGVLWDMRSRVRRCHDEPVASALVPCQTKVGERTPSIVLLGPFFCGAFGL